MRRLLATTFASAALLTVAATPAAAQTGHPVGGCPSEGGWVLTGYAPDNGSAILVDVVYGNNDGLLCDKLPSEHAPYDMIIDNVVPSAAQ